MKLSPLAQGRGLKLTPLVVLILLDYGLELSPEVEEELRESIKQKERGEVLPLEEVKKRLGL